jgi:RimJ/RimL family protein N-acetyltransferase
LEKILTDPEEKVIPKIPLVITTISDTSSLVVEDMNKILKLRGDFGISNFQERLGRRDVLFSAHSEREFVGFVWLDIPPVDHRNAGYRLKNDEAYTYDGYTFKEYRGNWIMPAIQQAIFVYLREKHPDIHSVVTHIQTKNKPSIAGDKRVGYIITGQDLGFVILGYFASFRLIRYQP